MHVEYRWIWGKAPFSADPFDRSKWLAEDPPSESNFRAWIIRPHLRIHQLRRGTAPKDMETSWINARRTGKHHDPDGGWSVGIDDSRWNLTGPIPFLTPLELQTFDVQESLFDLLRSGALVVASESGVDATLENGPTPLKVPWKLRAVLDKSHGLAPALVEASLDAPAGFIQWRMRTLRFDPVGAEFAIGEAILAMNNTFVDKTRWQIYHFKGSRNSRDPDLDIDDLRVDIPTTNVTVINELEGYARSIDAAGRVVDEEHWSREERAAQLASARVLPRVSSGNFLGGFV